jgi:hypothetical protein
MRILYKLKYRVAGRSSTIDRIEELIGEAVKKYENLVGLMNRGQSVRFVLTVDKVTKRYSTSVLKPDHFLAEVMPKRKVEIHFELYDSLDDLQQGIAGLAKGFKHNDGHIHCRKGGKEHLHEISPFGLKIGECPLNKRSRNI